MNPSNDPCPFLYEWSDMNPEERISYALNKMSFGNPVQNAFIRQTPEYIKAKEGFKQFQKKLDIIFPDRKVIPYPPVGLFRRGDS